MTMTPKFQLGQVVATPAALEVLRESGQDGSEFIDRHVRGDYGHMPLEDVAANEEAIRDDARVMSAYTTLSGTKIWVITEADRSVTTLLLPEDY
jgi:hypothetical protein